MKLEIGKFKSMKYRNDKIKQATGLFKVIFLQVFLTSNSESKTNFQKNRLF